MQAKAGAPIKTIAISGGVDRNEFVRQLLADATGIPVTSSATKEPVLLGSAILDACAAGAFAETRDAMAAMSHSAETCIPVAEGLGLFRSVRFDLFERFQSLARDAPSVDAAHSLCTDLGIEHRLTPPMWPQTNGMVERISGRIEDALQSHHSNNREGLEQTLMCYVHLYNTQLLQSALKARMPVLEMPVLEVKEWYSRKPELFSKRPYYLTGCDM